MGAARGCHPAADGRPVLLTLLAPDPGVPARRSAGESAQAARTFSAAAGSRNLPFSGPVRAGWLATPGRLSLPPARVRADVTAARPRPPEWELGAGAGSGQSGMLRAGLVAFLAGLTGASPAGRSPRLAVRRALPAGGRRPRRQPRTSVATDLATSSSSDPRAVSLATRLVTTSRISVSRRMVSVCLEISRFSRRSAPSWMAVARAVASSSICLACALAVATRALGVLGRFADGALGLQPGRVAHLVRLGPGGGDGVLGLLLGGGQHPLGLLAGLGADPVCFLLRILALLADLVLSPVALGLGLVVGELEDLADPLADLLVRGLAAQPLAGGGQFQAQPLGLVERVREPLLEITGLAARSRHELIHLPAAVPAHLDLEGIFAVDVGHQVCVISHGGTRR